MPTTLDHIKAFYTVCENLANYHARDNRPFAPRNDFERGVQDRILECLYILAGHLQECMGHIALVGLPGALQQDESRVKFFFAYAAMKTIKAMDYTMIEPVHTSPEQIREILGKVEAKLKDPIPADYPSVDYHEYGRGLEEGTQRFEETIVPAMIDGYGELLKRRLRHIPHGGGPAYL